jgi:hypothetical protein
VKDVVSASTSKDVTERLLFVIIGSKIFSRRATASLAPLVDKEVSGADFVMQIEKPTTV